jgi:hypothetical protein
MYVKPVIIIKRASIPAMKNKQPIHHTIFREGLKYIFSFNEYQYTNYHYLIGVLVQDRSIGDLTRSVTDSIYTK